MLSNELINPKAQRQNSRKITVKAQIQFMALATGGDRRGDDLLDQAADGLFGLALAICIRQAVDQALDARLIINCHARVDVQASRSCRGGGEILLELFLPLFKLCHTVLDALGRRARQDCVDQHVLILDHFGQVFAHGSGGIGLGCRQPVAFGDVFGGKGRDKLGVHQAL
ncbi:hypothetical protein [Cypionkella psychrotolerans]|uniref:hypothetical protein n=1 Tax=Cypionkella psychrotolerans TaxID=1678131 RepID=UPI002E20C327